MSINAPFALGTFKAADGAPFAGVVVGERVIKLSDVSSKLGLAATTVREVLEHWAAWSPALEASAADLASLPTLAFDSLTPLPPLEPRQIICTGANYKKHVADLGAAQPVPGDDKSTYEERFARTYAMMEERARTGRPYAFVKATTSLNGATGDVIAHSDVKQLDWELELAVVIGKGGFRIGRDQAMEHVAGYTIANDISARDYIYRPDVKALGTDWLASKCRKSYLPLGPVIVPASSVADPYDLTITLKLNGKAMQNESTSDMIFDIPRQIEYISSLVELYPGDVICTGSPAGNGMHYGRFLTPGDVMDGEITGMGAQRNLCVAE